MSNIYKWFIRYLYPNLVILFHPIESLNRIYPFDMMDNMSYIEDGDDVDSINTLFEDNMKIVDKICKYEKLNKNDFQYLETLSVSELMKCIRAYNDNY